MPRRTPRAQLRRCGNCQKIGHNKATCTESLQLKEQPIPPRPATVKFFVHHVAHTPPTSEHVVNLKQHHFSPWESVQTEAPQTAASNYQTYHLLREASAHESAPKKTELTRPFLPPSVQLAASKEKKPSTSVRLPLNIGTKIVTPFKKVGNAFALSVTTAKKIITLPRVAVLLIAAIFFSVVPTGAKSYVADLEQTKQALLSNSLAGFMALQNTTAGIKSANFTDARNANEEALSHFEQATSILQEKHRLLQTIVTAIPVVGGQVQSRQKLLLAGQQIALGNSYLLSDMEQPGTGSTTLLARIVSANNKLEDALVNYQSAADNLRGVDTASLPLEYQASFNDYRALFIGAVSDLKSAHQLADSLEEIFGGNGLRRYLLVFQNEHELRPTGGFMGSFAILDVKDGAIANLDIPPGGSYDLQGQLDTFVKPPTPLLLANKRWEFQDANWFPDFPASAEKILWFYRHARGRTADGVIAINSSVLTRLLTLTGPISDSTRGVTLDSRNAIPTLQHIVENGPEKSAHRPKQILSDIAPQFIDYFHTLNTKAILPLLLTTEEALANKEIQAYFVDQKTQNVIQEFGWSGRVLPGDKKDYLYVVNTNINSGKSDASIEQTISHQATVQADGSVIDTVVITREHDGDARDSLYGIANVDYVRVYVPEGSALVSAQGFSWPNERLFRVPDPWYVSDVTLASTETEITTDSRTGTRITSEFGKTAFGNWVITEPGETSRISFTYRLPFTVTPETSNNGWKKFLPNAQIAPYQLVVQKQSGIDSLFESQIILPDGWQPTWQKGPEMTLAKNGSSIQKQPLKTDTVWSLLIQK